MDNNERKVYKRGADDGFIFGAYLSVLIILLCSSVYTPMLVIPATLAMAFVPVVIYRFLRRSHKRDHGHSSFASLWLQGIITFVCGTMLMAVVAYLYMRFVHPDFLVEQVQNAAEIYRTIDTPQAQKMAHALDLLIENHMVPAPIYVVIEMMLMGIFTGSILSMIVTWIVRMRKVDNCV